MNARVPLSNCSSVCPNLASFASSSFSSSDYWFFSNDTMLPPSSASWLPGISSSSSFSLIPSVLLTLCLLSTGFSSDYLGDYIGATPLSFICPSIFLFLVPLRESFFVLLPRPGWSISWDFTQGKH